MTTNRVLIDAGPLVALYDRNDQHHQVCKETTLQISEPAYTCWPVITEAAYLLRHSERSVSDLLTKIQQGQLLLLPIDHSDAQGIKAIYEKYHFDFADTCLMHLADREGIEAVFTVDYRHFSLFRTTERKPLRLLPDMQKTMLGTSKPK